jgi:predicted TIM-barrel fold metal-dependent hydrolase
MARNGLLVIDSDLHVLEPADLWQRYLPARWRDQAPVGSTAGPRDISVLPDSPLGPMNRADFPLDDTARWGQALADHMGPLDPDYQYAVDHGWDADSQLEAMDREGIDVAVLFPSRGLFVLGFDTGTGPGTIEPAFASAIARAYNDWLHDFMDLDRHRLLGAAMVAPHDVDAAVAETRRCVEQLGFRTIFLLPGLVGGRPWHHPDYDPLWRTCEELDVPVSFHGGGVDWLTDFGLGHRSHLMMWHTFSHSLGPMAALVSFCSGGVLDRFPNLRAAFLEANCSWAPWLLHRLDEHYEEYTGRHEITLGRLPSEAFRANCWVSVEADEKPATLYVETFGDDNVVFSTDYPHPDSKFPHAVEAFLAGPLGPESKRKFLWDNCARLYRIPVPAGATPA